MSTTTQQNEQVLANQSQQTQIRDVQTRTIDQIRTQGLEPNTLEKIKADKAEMDRLEKQNAERLKGNYISFKDDKERKVLLFSGKYQKVDVPTKDFATGKTIENKFVQKWRFECYDMTDQTNPNPEVSIWERGWREAKVVMHFLGEQIAELVVVRNGAKGNSQTTYLIYPK
jgi:serine protease inhibitor ecotin